MACITIFSRYLKKNKIITHAIHIDIDEFITLKKHSNIKDFIQEYIINDCAGIGINWRFFGSSNHTEKTNDPNTLRFTMCEKNGNTHIKTLFNVKYLIKYVNGHFTNVKNIFFIKSTNGNILTDAHNRNIDLSIIQLNHYKVKTWPEFQYIRTRGYADRINDFKENILENFNNYNINEVEDLTAYNFYKNNCLN